MAVKISELPSLNTLADEDILAGVDTSANTTSKITLSTLKEYVDTNTTYTAGTNIDITNNVISAPNVYSKTQADTLLNAKENISNKVTTLSSSSTNTQYPSAKVVYDELNDLETDLTNDINDLNDEINNQINSKIQELEEELESVSTIYNAFPTVSDEDESMTLDGTAETKFKEFTLKGNTSQQSLSGKNKIKIDNTTQTISGVTFTQQSDGSIKVNGTATADIIYASSTYQRISPSTEYRLSGCPSGGSTSTYALQMLFGATTPSGQIFSDTGNGYTITTGDDRNYVLSRISIKNGTTVNNLVFYPQLELGSSSTSYEPYTGGVPSPNPDYPQDIQVVSGDNEIVVSGKNWFDKENTQWNRGNTSTYDMGGTSGTNTTRIRTTGFRIQGGKTYTISGMPEGVNFITVRTYTVPSGESTEHKTVSGNTFTLQDDVNYIHLLFGGENFTSATNTLMKNANIMINEGSSALPYEPYKGNTYNIDLPVENLLENTLTSQSANGIDYVVNDDKSVTINTSVKATDNTYKTYKEISLTPGTYTFSGCPSGGSNSTYRQFVYNVTDSSNVGYDNGSGLTFTAIEGKTYRFQIIVYNNAIVSNKTFKPMLEKGSKANSYTPFETTPIELCKIGNYRDYFVKSDGSQLFDKDNANILNGLITNTGGINSNASTRTLYIPCKPNTAYTISKISSARFVVGTTSSTPTLGGTTLQFQDFSTATSGTITTNSSANYLLVYYDNSGNTSTEQQIRNSIMINEGSSALPWQPYGVGKWYKYGMIKKYKLDSAKNWSYNSVTQGSLFRSNNSITDNINDDTYSPFSAYYKGIPSSSINSRQNNQFYIQTNNTFIDIIDNRYTNSDDFKSFIENNEVYVWYVLATPIGTEITYQPLIDQLNLLEKAMSKDKQTNISQINNDKPFIIKAEAILSLQNVLDRVTLLES